MENVWKKVLSEIQLEVSPATFATLFKKTVLISVEENVATINCTSPILSNLIEARYYSLLKKTLDKHLDKNVSLVFKNVGQDKTEDNGETEKERPLGPLFINQPLEDVIRKARLNILYTFENFAVSGTNQLAFAAAQMVAKKMNGIYSPLFIYGGVGVGKTHLMQAVASDILSRKPKTKIIYCMGEEFTNELIFSIRSRNTREFKDKFRNAQVLLIDDIQFIAGKDTVQEEFFHTFNAIMSSGGQIILTSDKPPSEIKKLERRIISRFEGGLTVDIEPPDFGLRTAIILIKARIRGIELPIEVAKILAENIEDVRKLEGVLIRLTTESQMRNIPIDEQLAIRVCGAKQERKRITKDELLTATCSFYNLKPSLVLGPKRNASLVLPRQVLMYLLRQELSLTFSEIGTLLGGRDHTTVMYGIEKIENLLANSTSIKEDLLGIKRIVLE